MCITICTRISQKLVETNSRDRIGIPVSRRHFTSTGFKTSLYLDASLDIWLKIIELGSEDGFCPSKEQCRVRVCMCVFVCDVCVYVCLCVYMVAATFKWHKTGAALTDIAAARLSIFSFFQNPHQYPVVVRFFSPFFSMLFLFPGILAWDARRDTHVLIYFPTQIFFQTHLFRTHEVLVCFSQSAKICNSISAFYLHSPRFPVGRLLSVARPVQERAMTGESQDLGFLK